MTLIRTPAEAREETIRAGVADMLSDTDHLVTLLDDILSEESVRKDLMTAALRTLFENPNPGSFHHHLALDTMAEVFFNEAHDRATRRLGRHHLV